MNPGVMLTPPHFGFIKHTYFNPYNTILPFKSQKDDTAKNLNIGELIHRIACITSPKIDNIRFNNKLNKAVEQLILKKKLPKHPKVESPVITFCFPHPAKKFGLKEDWFTLSGSEATRFFHLLKSNKIENKELINTIIEQQHDNLLTAAPAFISANGDRFLNPLLENKNDLNDYFTVGGQFFDLLNTPNKLNTDFTVIHIREKTHALFKNFSKGYFLITGNALEKLRLLLRPSGFELSTNNYIVTKSPNKQRPFTWISQIYSWLKNKAAVIFP